MHMHKPTTKPRKQRDEKIKPTRLTKEKLATKRGNKPQAPLASEKSLMLKWLGKDICGLPLWRDMDQVYVSSLMIVSQEMESDIYVLGSGV